MPGEPAKSTPEKPRMTYEAYDRVLKTIYDEGGRWAP